MNTQTAEAHLEEHAEETSGSLTLLPTDQYQHFIPRFILRRFQVGPVKSKKERKEQFRLTRVDPEYVHYFDIATRSLAILPIREVYGVLNFYQDVRNTDNINELEDKLARLEGQAATIIGDMHEALPRGTFTLKRSHLELLRKFLFIMHYRNVSCSSNYFQVDHPHNAKGRQWIECLMKAKGMQSSVETWLYFLRYYLDTSHSDIMKDAAELIEKYGLEGLQKMLSESHMPPDLERFPAIMYHVYADCSFLNIWEAAEDEEFILTHNAFGLWEGLTGDSPPALRHIFVVGPRIAIIMCSSLLRPESKDHTKLDPPLKSSLLNVNPAPATPNHVTVNIVEESSKSSKSLKHSKSSKSLKHSKSSKSLKHSKSSKSLKRYRSSQEGENDSFDFEIAKLSRTRTFELNAVLLLNMKEAGALTFLSKERMLRTAHEFRSNIPESNQLVPLIQHLTPSTPGSESSPLQSPAVMPDEDNDAPSRWSMWNLMYSLCWYAWDRDS